MSFNATPNVQVKILDPRLNQWGLPSYQSAMAAAIDLFACLDAPLVIPVNSPAVLIPTGIAVLMGDPHMVATLVPRSGLGHKKGLILGNTIGVIDADYTGQIQISAWNRSAHGDITIEPGERIAQMMFLPILRPEFSVVDEFSEITARGAGGFGSTGS